ncbi:MAG: hypothetical protein ACJ8CO_03175, partial [Microvirga sp.]
MDASSMRDRDPAGRPLYGGLSRLFHLPPGSPGRNFPVTTTRRRAERFSIEHGPAARVVAAQHRPAALSVSCALMMSRRR